MKFIYHEKIKPYVRMTQRGKFVKKEAQDYLASKAALGYALRVQMQQAEAQPLEQAQTFELTMRYLAPDVYRYDLDNVIKAVLDAAQNIVFPDDRYCIDIVASKARAVHFRLEMEIVKV